MTFTPTDTNNYTLGNTTAGTTADIGAANQTITFAQIATQVESNRIGLAATVSSRLLVTFATNGGPALIDGGTNLTFTGPGVVSIVASQAGDGNWNAAPNVTNMFRVYGYVHANDRLCAWDGQSCCGRLHKFGGHSPDLRPVQLTMDGQIL